LCALERERVRELGDRLTSEHRGLFSPLFLTKKPPVKRRLPTGNDAEEEVVSNLARPSSAHTRSLSVMTSKQHPFHGYGC
jgi:hypothetical protein